MKPFPRKSKQYSFEHNNKSKSQSKLYQTNSNFPQIDQSTQAQTFYSSNNNTTLSSIKKKIPRNILTELKHTDKDFFLTLQDPQIKSRRTNNAEQIKLKPLKRQKREKEIDKVISSVQDAVDKLRVNMKPEKLQINNISDSDSDNEFGSMGTKSTKEKNKLAKSTLQQQSKTEDKVIQYKNVIQEFPDVDKELGNFSRILKSKVNQSQESGNFHSNKLYNTRQEQIKSMQGTLQDGQKKYDNLVRLVGQRDIKLQQLLILIQDSDNELFKMTELHNVIKGDNSDLRLNIEKNLHLLEIHRQQKESLKHMKTNKRKDLDLVKKRCDESKTKNKEFENFLNKEIQNLIYESKKLDEIRTKFQQEQEQKDQVEQRLEKQLKEHAYNLQKEEEILEVIQLEQAAQDKQQTQKAEYKEFQKARSKQEQQQVKNQIEQEKINLRELEEQYYKLKAQLNGSNTFEDIIPQLQDLKGTNKFCIDKKVNIIKEMEETRKQIKDQQQILFKVKCKQVEVAQDDPIAKEFEEIELKQTQQQLQDEKNQAQKNKETELFFKQTLQIIDRGLKNMCQTLLQYNIPGMQQQQQNNQNIESHIEKKSSAEVSEEIIKGLNGIIQVLESNKIDEKKIEEILYKKYKDMDPDDSFQGMKDIEVMNSDSSISAPDDLSNKQL